MVLQMASTNLECMLHKEVLKSSVSETKNKRITNETLFNIVRQPKMICMPWRSSVFIVNFEHISHLVLVFLFLTWGF